MPSRPVQKMVKCTRWALQTLFVLSLAVSALPRRSYAQSAASPARSQNQQNQVISDLPATPGPRPAAKRSPHTASQAVAVKSATASPVEGKSPVSAPAVTSPSASGTTSAPAPAPTTPQGQASAQQNAAPSLAEQSAEQNAEQSAQHPASPEQQVTHASRQAAHEEPDENAAFKYSSSVKYFSKLVGGDVQKGYWIFTVLNFVIIAAAILWLWKSLWPGMVRGRNERIRRGLEEARRTSEEAQRRLGDIESRLGKLDTEISLMRTQAESEGKAEEERMKIASADEKKRILEAADQEIASASAQARRDLKAFAAEMAVSLAQSRIASGIDASSDEQLVREFAQRLGKEGHA